MISKYDLPEVMTTIEAAKAMNYAPQTLRKWACLGNGPLAPVKINGRLKWKTADIYALLSGASQ